MCVRERVCVRERERVCARERESVCVCVHTKESWAFCNISCVVLRGYIYIREGFSALQTQYYLYLCVYWL